MSTAACFLLGSSLTPVQSLLLPWGPGVSQVCQCVSKPGQQHKPLYESGWNLWPPQTPSRMSYFQTLPLPKCFGAFLSHGKKRICFSFFQSGFWFSFCGSALLRFVYQHQSWNQMCLFVDLLFSWNLQIFLGHSMFLIIRNIVIRMSTKKELGGPKDLKPTEHPQ